MKTCRTCRKLKQVQDFYKNDLGEMGLSSSCKECSRKFARKNSKEKQRWKHLTVEQQKKRAINKKDWHLQNSYGISLASFTFLLESQGGCCACCDHPMTRPHVDHDHLTRKVRGLLCGTCNTGIGQFGEDPVRCERAAVYLRKHRT